MGKRLNLSKTVAIYFRVVIDAKRKAMTKKRSAPSQIVEEFGGRQKEF
jgi:hypothetical protein